MKELRLLPLVVFAGVCLLLLKITSHFFLDSQLLTGSQALNAQETEAQKSGKKEEAKSPPKDKTDVKEAEKVVDKKTSNGTQKDVLGPANKHMKPTTISDMKVAASPSEIELLESLAQRRKTLNEREKQLSLKENLLKAAEKQIDERIQELKKIEAKIQKDLNRQDVLRQAQYKNLVKIYSSMKPKEAARIFDGLEGPVLVGLIRAMKPAAGSQILAKMNPEKARMLTLKLAEKEAVQMAKNKVDDSGLPAVEGDKPAKENQ